jgi:phosphohistidine phosphatase
VKTLMVLRHAKSPHLEDVDDHDRPTFPEACKRVRRLARRLAAGGLVPEVVLSSDARRAVETAQAYAEAAETPEPVLLPDLYEPGEPEDILDAIRQHGGDAAVDMVVGHNPGMEDFCNRVTPKPAVEHLGTGSVASFSIEAASWSDLRFGEARLVRVEAS